MKKFIIGIDEVGRGALAGPVVVAAALLPRVLKFNGVRLGTLKDSKKLSPGKREKWFEFFKSHPEISFRIARVYPRAIERMNISNAANRAATRAYCRLIGELVPRRSPDAGGKNGKITVFLDGGLYLENGDKSARTVIKGDEKIAAIKAASIIAKVSRDRSMERLSRAHPQYDFAVHKGYGTRKHFQAIRKHGPGLMHRLTFLKKYPTITVKS